MSSQLRAVCVADFKGSGTKHIPLSKGMHVQIINRTQKHFWLVETVDGVQGLVAAKSLRLVVLSPRAHDELGSRSSSHGSVEVSPVSLDESPPGNNSENDAVVVVEQPPAKLVKSASHGLLQPSGVTPKQEPKDSLKPAKGKRAKSKRRKSVEDKILSLVRKSSSGKDQQQEDSSGDSIGDVERQMPKSKRKFGSKKRKSVSRRGSDDSGGGGSGKARSASSKTDKNTSNQTLKSAHTHRKSISKSVDEMSMYGVGEGGRNRAVHFGHGGEEEESGAEALPRSRSVRFGQQSSEDKEKKKWSGSMKRSGSLNDGFKSAAGSIKASLSVLRMNILSEEESESDSVADECDVLFTAGVVQDYLGAKDKDELSIIKGEVVTITKTWQPPRSHFIFGRCSDGRQGFFPLRMVQFDARVANPYHGFYLMIQQGDLLARLLRFADAAQCEGLVIALLYNGEFFDRVSAYSRAEIEKDLHESSVLFRSISATTQLVSAYMKLIMRPFLMATCGPTLTTIEKKPQKYGGDGNEHSDAVLADEIELLLGRLTTKFDQVPLGLRAALHVIRQQLLGVTGDDRATADTGVLMRHLVIGGFFFLRCVNPCISQATLIKSKDPAAKKVHIALSKVLQRLSNNVSFEEGPFATMLNRCLLSCKKPEKEVDHKISSNEYANAMANVHALCSSFLMSLRGDQREEFADLQQLVIALGDVRPDLIPMTLEEGRSDEPLKCRLKSNVVAARNLVNSLPI